MWATDECPKLWKMLESIETHPLRLWRKVKWIELFRWLVVWFRSKLSEPAKVMDKTEFNFCSFFNEVFYFDSHYTFTREQISKLLLSNQLETCSNEPFPKNLLYWKWFQIDTSHSLLNVEWECFGWKLKLFQTFGAFGILIGCKWVWPFIILFIGKVCF